MEIHEALQNYFKAIGLSQVAIAESLGVSKAYVNALLGGRQRFGKRQAEIWSNKFGISKSWLLTGEGNMLNASDGAASNAKIVGEVFPADQKDEDVMMVDFVPISATATFVESLSEGRNADLDKYPIVPFGNERNEIDSLRIFEVDGDSMFPTIPSGSLILAKEIPARSWHYAEGVVVAVFSDYVVVKRVARNHLLTENYLVLRSDNEGYGEMTVALADLRALFKAKRIISSEIR
jgi:phage repressor protein C with HTH and peptisase S24 domain